MLSSQGRPSLQAQKGRADQAPADDQHEADHGDTVGNLVETAVALRDTHSANELAHPVDVVFHSFHSFPAQSPAATSRLQMKSTFLTNDCAIVQVVQSVSTGTTTSDYQFLGKNNRHTACRSSLLPRGRFVGGAWKAASPLGVRGRRGGA